MKPGASSIESAHGAPSAASTPSSPFESTRSGSKRRRMKKNPWISVEIETRIGKMIRKNKDLKIRGAVGGFFLQTRWAALYSRGK